MEHKTSEARRRANAKYDKSHTKQFNFKLNLQTDSDIIEKFKSVDNVQGYIKGLVREDISNH